MTVALENRSDELVYELWMVVATENEDLIARIGHVPPGRTQHVLRAMPSTELPRLADVVIEFTDGAGHRWRREGRGRLLSPPPQTPASDSLREQPEPVTESDWDL